MQKPMGFPKLSSAHETQDSHLMVVLQCNMCVQMQMFT